MLWSLKHLHDSMCQGSLAKGDTSNLSVMIVIASWFLVIQHCYLPPIPLGPYYRSHCFQRVEFYDSLYTINPDFQRRAKVLNDACR